MAEPPERIPVEIEWRVDGLAAHFASPPLATGAAMVLWAALVGGPLGLLALMCGPSSSAGTTLMIIAGLVCFPALIFLSFGGSMWDHRVKTTLTIEAHRIQVSSELETLDLPLDQLREVRISSGSLELHTDDRVVRIRADGNQPRSIKQVQRELQRIIDRHLDDAPDPDDQARLDRLLQRTTTEG